jgi:hypothetical protein
MRGRGRHGPVPALTCALAVLLCGCPPLLQVRLASQEEQLPAPRFVVSDPDHPDRPRYDTLQVMDRDGTLLWHLRAEPFGSMNSVGQFTYGESLAGFETVDGPAPLRPGGRYALFVLGMNRGSLHFDVSAEGRVLAVPP